MDLMLRSGLVLLVLPGSKMHGQGSLCNWLPLAALYFFTLKAFSHLKETRWLSFIVVFFFFLSFCLFFNTWQDDVKWSQLPRSCSTDFICIGVLGCVVWEHVVQGLGTRWSCSVFQRRYERKKEGWRKEGKINWSSKEWPRVKCALLKLVSKSVFTGAKFPCLLSDFDLNFAGVLKINKR